MKKKDLIHLQYDYKESEDYYDMGCEWIKHNNLEKAEICLKHAIEFNEHFIYAYITLSEVYAKLKRWHDAVHVLRQAFHIDPQFDKLPFMISEYSFKAGDYRNALKFIGKAIELNPEKEYLAFQEVIEDFYKQ